MVCRRPQEPKNETPCNAPKRNIGNLQDKLHIAFGAFLFAPPLETATRADYMRFRNTTKANCLFSAYVYLHNIPKGKKIGKHLAYLAYIFNAFFLLGRFGRTGGRTGGLFLWVTGHHLGTYPRWYRNAPER